MNQIFTIGHSNHILEYFVGLLEQHAVRLLVDTRSAPYSRYAPQFNRNSLERAVERAGLAYLYQGDELGGRPRGMEFYDSHGRALYSRMARAPAFLAAVDELEREGARRTTAIMCSEEDPAVCHRYLLLARVLRERGIEIQHIRGDGRLQPDSELVAPRRRRGPQPGQLGLFAAAEDMTWRSIRSVLPNDPPRDSSEP